VDRRSNHVGVGRKIHSKDMGDGTLSSHGRKERKIVGMERSVFGNLKEKKWLPRKWGEMVLFLIQGKRG